MSADKTPGKPVAEVVKDAEVVSTPSRPDGAPAPKPISFGQQLFIWAMVLVVGVIFGVGSSWTFLQQPARVVGGISETDILPRQEVAQRLQAIIGGETGQSFVPRSYDGYANNLRLARYAAGLGLMPAGADLDRVVDEFLAKEVPGGKRTYRDLLVEHQGAKDQVSRPQLRQYLAEQAATQALYARHLAAPAVPLTVADEIEVLRRTRIAADEATLTAEHLLPTVAVDDPELQSTYDRLRATRFTRRAQVTATAASADLAALAAKAVVGEAEVQAWYDGHKETYRAAPAADAKPDAAPVYKPLADVAAEVKATLARQQAEKAAQEALTAFNNVIEEKDLERADQAGFSAAAKNAGLVVSGPMTIDEPQGGEIDLGAFGRIKDPAGVFAKDPGFISNPLQAGGTERTWFVLRIDGKTAAGFRTLDEVKPELQQIVAGNRAYKALLDQAEALRAAAEKAGPGGLAKVLADPANAAWKATVTERNLTPLEDLRAPAGEVGGASGEARLAASLTLPDRPVALVEGSENATTPSVRLIQVRAVTRDDSAPAGPAEGAASAYRYALTGYRGSQFDRELRDQLQK